ASSTLLPYTTLFRSSRERPRRSPISHRRFTHRAPPEHLRLRALGLPPCEARRRAVHCHRRGRARPERRDALRRRGSARRVRQLEPMPLTLERVGGERHSTTSLELEELPRVHGHTRE